MNKAIKKTDYTISAKPLITQAQFLHIFQKTPKEHIFTRPAKGGGTWDFVTGVYVKKVLNYCFGWNWSFEVKDKIINDTQVIVLGKLTINSEGGQIIKEQFGRADIKHNRQTKLPLDLGNDLKAATTDALKKCASELGIANDIYGKQEFKEIDREKFIGDVDEELDQLSIDKINSAQNVEELVTICQLLRDDSGKSEKAILRHYSIRKSELEVKDENI